MSAGVVAAPGLLAACGGSEDGASAGAAAPEGFELSSNTVVFADYGGETTEARREAYFDSFEQETGVRVESASADPARFKLMAEQGRSQWDGMDVDGYLVAAFHDENLLVPYPSFVERNDLVPQEYRDVATGGFAYSQVQGYLPATFSGTKPETWADFFDTSRFPGRRAYPKVPLAVIEPALLADGVEPAELYPLDFDRAIAKLEEIRDDTLFYESYGQGQQLLQAGSIDLIAIPNNRITQLSQGGVPTEIVWNQGVLLAWSGASIPKGPPHANAMFALANWMADAERQAEFSKLSAVGPNNSKAFDFMDEETLSVMPNSPEHRQIAVEVDAKQIGEQQEEYARRYSDFLAGAATAGEAGA